MSVEEKEDATMTELLKRFVLVVIALLFLTDGWASAQAAEIRPVTLGQPMADFTLPVYQGGELTLSKLKGKNVLLIFPRGFSREGSWCHVCNYQYAELVELEQDRQIRKQRNLEILFILPYRRELVEQWLAKFPAQLADLENWRNPPDPEHLDDAARQRRERAMTYFPKGYAYDEGKVPTPFPILVDAERTVTKGLGIFTTEWGGSKVEQNVPTVMILDEEGTVQFKYLSQNTLDRPSAEYLMRFLDSREGK